jgi:hypothetical protein
MYTRAHEIHTSNEMTFMYIHMHVKIFQFYNIHKKKENINFKKHKFIFNKKLSSWKSSLTNYAYYFHYQKIIKYR